MPSATDADITRMRDQLFFEGPDIARRLSRFWLLLVLAAVIAAAGVVSDSTATVIGAMIVAPLMVPILGAVVSVVLADRDNLLRSVVLVVAGAASVIAIGYLIGLFVDTPVVAATNSQVASRVAPTLMALVAALATGAVGSVALARDDISDTLPGVAIAISLVPPLAVVGLTWESDAPEQALGSLLLFGANVTAILASGLVVMGIYRVHTLATTVSGGHRIQHRSRLVAVVALSLVVVAVPLTLISLRINGDQTTESAVTSAADRWATDVGWSIVSVSTEADQTVVRATGPLPEPETGDLDDALDAAGLSGEPVRVELVPSHTVVLGTRD
jgi:uncharacterized hydrophobic protein (TIGR00271 family)